MKALILAAGLGSRLRPLTDNIPKCMVKVNGVMIIDNQIESLIENNINDIYIITGYKNEILEQHLKEKYKNLNITILFNKDFDTTNNMFSLFMAKKYLSNKKFIMMNSDVFFEKRVISDLINNEYSNLIVCQKDNYNEESMKIIIKEEFATEISKNITKKDSYGTSIDVYKFGCSESEKLFDIISDYIFIKKDMNSWSEVAINELLKYKKFKSLDISCKWIEIDNLYDLEEAKKIF